MTSPEGDRLDRAVRLLRRHWGHDSFRPGQTGILADVLAGGDVLGIMPTGGGKSLCYQLPALLQDGLTLVVSPLVALMADQVTGLESRGIPATWLGSALSFPESEQRWNDLLAGRYRLLYVAPERLRSDRFRARAHRLNVCRIAVDEAHCVSEWGHDFRPEYLRIADTRKELGDVPITAVTATATPPVRRDIVRLLGLRRPAVHVHGFDRPNLVWSVFDDPDKPGRVRDVLDAVPGGGILYASTRRGVEAWAERLRRTGEPVAMYHAGLASEERRRAQDAWASGRTRVIVATSAFGMGIDRADVRFVLHVDPPSSVEAYYQEAGRAGRDGRSAHAVLLVDDRDRRGRLDRLRVEHPGVASIRQVFDVVCSMARVVVGSVPGGPMTVDAHRIASACGLPSTTVRRAIDLLAASGVWTPRRIADGHGVLRMTAPVDVLKRWAGDSHNGPRGALVDRLLRRMDASAWSAAVNLDAKTLAEDPDDEHAVTELLDRLDECGLASWIPPGRTILLEMDEPRPARVRVDSRAVRRSGRRARERFRDLMAYVDARGCRRRFLLAYFGEPAPDRCGRCDVCTKRHVPVVPDPSDEPLLRAILAAVSSGETLDRTERLADVPRWRRRAMADWLVSEGLLERARDGSTGYALTNYGRERLTDGDQRVRSALI